MDKTTFISQIIGDLAWPLTLLVCIFLFRSEVKGFAGRILKVKVGDTELAFAREMSKMSEKPDDLVKVEGSFKDPELHVKAIELSQIARIDPKASVLSVYAQLETVARAAAELEKSSLKLQSKVSLSQIITTLEGKPLMGNDKVQFMTLAKLRNQVAHADNFQLSGMLVQEYIEHCLSLIDLLNEHIAKKPRKTLEASKKEN